MSGFKLQRRGAGHEAWGQQRSGPYHAADFRGLARGLGA